MSSIPWEHLFPPHKSCHISRANSCTSGRLLLMYVPMSQLYTCQNPFELCYWYINVQSNRPLLTGFGYLYTLGCVHTRTASASINIVTSGTNRNGNRREIWVHTMYITVYWLQQRKVFPLFMCISLWEGVLRVDLQQYGHVLVGEKSKCLLRLCITNNTFFCGEQLASTRHPPHITIWERKINLNTV